MKRCGRCGCFKPLGEFHRAGNARQAWCKECRRQYDAEYWSRTRTKRLRQRKELRAELLEWSRRLKEGKPCADCGGVFHHSAMHWDHLPGVPKRREVSNLVRRGFTKSTILGEIAKCELVCANCHAVRTFDRATGRSSAW